MLVKRLSVKGFRSLYDIDIEFEPDITVLVGENDCGKSSVLQCIEIITGRRNVEIDDFAFGRDRIDIALEIDDFTYCQTFTRVDYSVQPQPIRAFPSREFLARAIDDLQNMNLESDIQSAKSSLRYYASIVKAQVRSNTNWARLRDRLVNEYRECASCERPVFNDVSPPDLNVVQLGGRHFENVSAFFKEAFLKPKQKDIWTEQVDDDTTLEEFVQIRLKSYSDEIDSKMKSEGIYNNIKLFLSSLTEIKVTPIFEPRDLNIDVKVQFLEGEKEIDLSKKGDGTKRRITMALLECRNSEQAVDGLNTLYLLDEPDTHLHVSAQMDLLHTLSGFANSNNQVIIATHSPFIINSVRPRQVRLICLDTTGNSFVRRLRKGEKSTEMVLRELGIENTYLFFARKVILVEGETDKVFLETVYERLKGRTMSASLIKVINIEGVQNVHGFAHAISELHNLANVYVLADNDASDEIHKLSQKLDLPEANLFTIGTQEFEDAFAPETIYEAWKKYLDIYSCRCGKEWTLEAVRNLHQECTGDGTQKLSEAVRSLNRGSGKKMSKPNLGLALGSYCTVETMPEVLNDLLSAIG